MTLVLRPAGTPKSMQTVLDTAIASIDPDLPSPPVRPMPDLVRASLSFDRFQMSAVGALAAIGFMLSVVGLYAVTSFAVRRRRREIGVRIALGATAGGILRLVVADAMRLVAAGVALGLVFGWLGSRAIRASLFSVQSLDPATISAVVATVVLIMLVASLVPALRAAATDPIALRAD
jgi:putative ABC transport system permease protein